MGSIPTATIPNPDNPLLKSDFEDSSESGESCDFGDSGDSGKPGDSGFIQIKI